MTNRGTPSASRSVAASSGVGMRATNIASVGGPRRPAVGGAVHRDENAQPDWISDVPHLIPCSRRPEPGRRPDQPIGLCGGGLRAMSRQWLRSVSGAGRHGVPCAGFVGLSTTQIRLMRSPATSNAITDKPAPPCRSTRPGRPVDRAFQDHRAEQSRPRRLIRLPLAACRFPPRDLGTGTAFADWPSIRTVGRARWPMGFPAHELPDDEKFVVRSGRLMRGWQDVAREVANAASAVAPGEIRGREVRSLTAERPPHRGPFGVSDRSRAESRRKQASLRPQRGADAPPTRHRTTRRHRTGGTTRSSTHETTAHRPSPRRSPGSPSGRPLRLVPRPLNRKNAQCDGHARTPSPAAVRFGPPTVRSDTPSPHRPSALGPPQAASLTGTRPHHFQGVSKAFPDLHMCFRTVSGSSNTGNLTVKIRRRQFYCRRNDRLCPDPRESRALSSGNLLMATRFRGTISRCTTRQGSWLTEGLACDARYRKPQHVGSFPNRRHPPPPARI